MMVNSGLIMIREIATPKRKKVPKVNEIRGKAVEDNSRLGQNLVLHLTKKPGHFPKLIKEELAIGKSLPVIGEEKGPFQWQLMLWLLLSYNK